MLDHKKFSEYNEKQQRKIKINLILDIIKLFIVIFGVCYLCNKFLF